MSAPASKKSVIAFDIDGTHFYGQDGQPNTLFFLPAAPVPELDAKSRPALTLVKMPQSSILQLGAQFTLTPGERSAVVGAIAAQQPAFANAQLQPAPVTVLSVDLLLVDSLGDVATLKSSTSSGFPPYTAVFSVSLTPAQSAQAIAAINGRSGLLFVDYKISLPADLAATLDGAPNTLVLRADVANWFSGGEGSSHLQVVG